MSDPTNLLTEEKTELKRSLGFIDATLLVSGSMIGSGIFIVSTEMTTLLGSSGWLISAWLLTGFLTLTAAVSYGELSSMFPKAGGQYVYLREAYNPLVAFLFGWTQFSVIQTGTIAAVAVAFAARSNLPGFFRRRRRCRGRRSAKRSNRRSAPKPLGGSRSSPG